MIAHGLGPDLQTPDYTLLQGDITDAYSKKVKQVTRSFAFFNLRDARMPAAMIVFDRVTSADPAFRKFWLLHCQEEPKLGDGSAIVKKGGQGEGGRLTLDVLLPQADNLSLEKVGGPGREYWVFGTNHVNDPDPQRGNPNSMELGSWRIEVSPKQPATEDLFLTAMQVSDRGSDARLPVRRIETADRIGVFIEHEGNSRMVLFSRNGKRSGQSVAFEVPGRGGCGILVADLEPGIWQSRREGGDQVQTVWVSEESFAAWFEGTGGQWTIVKQ